MKIQFLTIFVVTILLNSGKSLADARIASHGRLNGHARPLNVRPPTLMATYVEGGAGEMKIEDVKFRALLANAISQWSHKAAKGAGEAVFYPRYYETTPQEDFRSITQPLKNEYANIVVRFAALPTGVKSDAERVQYTHMDGTTAPVLLITFSSKIPWKVRPLLREIVYQTGQFFYIPDNTEPDSVFNPAGEATKISDADAAKVQAAYRR